jgi:hypothetical protein
MKQLLSILIIFSLFIHGSSCKKLLEETPITFLGDDAVYSTEKGAEAALVGLYSRLNNLENFGLYYWQLIPSLSGTVYSGVATFRDLITMNPTLNNVRINGFWTQSYTVINIANDIISKLPGYDINSGVKSSVLGQAYFLRAVTYFNIVRLWGAVPLRLTPTTVENIHMSRTDVEQVWQAIVDDLEMAKSLLPEPQQQDKSRPHKYAAHALLAKVYMTRASMSESSTSPFWNLAYTEAKLVFDAQAYRLERPFSALWVPGNENTKESIFEIQQSTQTSEWKTQIYMPPGHPTLAGGTAGGVFRSNKDIYDDHVRYYPGDSRLDMYIDSQYTRADNNVTVVIYPRNRTVQGWPYFFKYYSANRNGFFAEKNYIYFRYAELLLMLAEIENELRGPDQAYQYVNLVLARARDINGDGVDDNSQPANWLGMTQDEFRLRIMQERLYELRAEGGEWFEARRRGYNYFLEHVIRKHNNSSSFDPVRDFAYPEDPKNMLLPIPAVEINSNQLIGPQDQNPGY